MMHLRILLFFYILLSTWALPATTFAQDPPVPGADQKLRVAVAPMMSPSDTFESYFRLLQYLGSKLGMELEFVQRKTHAEVRDLLTTPPTETVGLEPTFLPYPQLQGSQP